MKILLHNQSDKQKGDMDARTSQVHKYNQPTSNMNNTSCRWTDNASLPPHFILFKVRWKKLTLLTLLLKIAQTISN